MIFYIVILMFWYKKLELSVNKTSIYYKKISCLSLKGNDGVDFIKKKKKKKI
jgi:hypothetical protein